MKSILLSRGKRAAVGAIASAAIMFGALGGGATAVAFDNVWVLSAGAGCDLWDDAPGAGIANDSAFVWVRNGAAANESCTWAAAVPGISSTSFPQLRVRLAANDSSRVTVQVWNNVPAVIGTVTQTGNNQFVVLTATLPPNQVIRRVTLTIDDNPDAAVPSARSTGLVDSIQILNPSSGALGWQETFTRAL
jgi:hypothetical protein